MDFLYAQTRNAFGKMQEVNALTNEPEIIGSFNEDFAKTIEDLTAYLDFAEQQGYENIVLAGHSLGANKVIYYLSETQDPRVSKFYYSAPPISPI
ncbi:Uncharacterised protein [Actinobacillus equuli]|nr:Uncharacterised protein [Actinobacillus equuli]